LTTEVPAGTTPAPHTVTLVSAQVVTGTSSPAQANDEQVQELSPCE
jgi:hypothetical protein